MIKNKYFNTKNKSKELDSKRTFERLWNLINALKIVVMNSSLLK